MAHAHFRSKVVLISEIRKGDFTLDANFIAAAALLSKIAIFDVFFERLCYN